MVDRDALRAPAPRLPAAALLGAALLVGGLTACGDDDDPRRWRPDVGPLDAATDAGAPMDAKAPPTDAGPPPDTSFLHPDAACVTAELTAQVERLPVDILWVVDNSISMAPAIMQVNAGLNAFADRIYASGLAYRVIMLSLRGRGELSVGGGRRFGVCIPSPLSGDGACGDGPRFFQVELDVRSTQPVEQLLGSLAQTLGYRAGEPHGSAPWLHLLRPEATKTIVFVTDDNARTCDRPVGATCAAADPPLTVTSLEDFPGGPNPFNSRELGPGLRTAAYGALFEGYVFSALYGWGSDTDPDAICTYPDATMPPSAGQTYTALVGRTGGARARICDGAAAWDPFFDAVASAVTRTSRIECDVAIPPPPDGMLLDPGRVNVFVRTPADRTVVHRRAGPGACDERGGWYYDDPVRPTRVLLCPATCALARETLGPPGTGLDVQLGCDSVLI